MHSVKINVYPTQQKASLRAAAETIQDAVCVNDPIIWLGVCCRWSGLRETQCHPMSDYIQAAQGIPLRPWCHFVLDLRRMPAFSNISIRRSFSVSTELMITWKFGLYRDFRSSEGTWRVQRGQNHPHEYYYHPGNTWGALCRRRRLTIPASPPKCFGVRYSVVLAVA